MSSSVGLMIGIAAELAIVIYFIIRYLEVELIPMSPTVAHMMFLGAGCMHDDI
jgi:hypothetical protein